ncbi:hypothetical protein P5V15_014450 [Pogonomyrmex californicus]
MIIDRDCRSLQDLTDDRKSRTDHRRSTGAGRQSTEQIKSNQTENHCKFVFTEDGFSDYRSLPTIISRERCGPRTALSEARKRTRTGRNCDNNCDPRDAREMRNGTWKQSRDARNNFEHNESRVVFP